MFHLWDKITTVIKIDKFKRTKPVTPVVVVVVHDGKIGSELIRLACLMAKAVRSQLYLLSIIEVPRSLPVEATFTKEFNVADEMLQQGLAIAKEEGCDDALAGVIQAREAGVAIVEVVRSRACSLLLLALVRDGKNYQAQREQAMFVMRNVSCRVFVFQDLSN